MSGDDFTGAVALARPESTGRRHRASAPPDAPDKRLRRGQRVEAIVVETHAEESHARMWPAVVVTALVSALTGGGLVTALTQPEPAPASIPITLETFPREFMGSERNDLALRDAGFGPTVERLDREFEAQLVAHRFAHGGGGATLGYGRLITLTIVDGILAPEVPRQGELDFAGRVRETRRIISSSTTRVSCTFEPEPVLDKDRGMEGFGEFSGLGRTECVLVDRDRNLSLRLAHTPAAGSAESIAAASTFRDALESLHADLVGVNG